jgi:hypothetical protein
MLSVNYSTYENCVSEQLLLSPQEWSFKSNPNYQCMLEHVSGGQGVEYLNVIKSEFEDFYSKHKNELVDWCLQNDSLGSPIKTDFSGFCNCSPTNLRYIYHALLILKHYQDDDINKPRNGCFIEIGGGYGGLCFFIHKIASKYNIEISNYFIFDLPKVVELQRKYLNYFNINAVTLTLDDDVISFDSGTNFLISNYAFSEIDEIYQKRYETCVIPFCNRGFMVWNHKPFFKFTSCPIIKAEIERPFTGSLISSNKFVYF